MSTPRYNTANIRSEVYELLRAHCQNNQLSISPTVTHVLAKYLTDANPELLESDPSLRVFLSPPNPTNPTYDNENNIANPLSRAATNHRAVMEGIRLLRSKLDGIGYLIAANTRITGDVEFDVVTAPTFIANPTAYNLTGTRGVVQTPATMRINPYQPRTAMGAGTGCVVSAKRLLTTNKYSKSAETLLRMGYRGTHIPVPSQKALKTLMFPMKANGIDPLYARVNNLYDPRGLLPDFLGVTAHVMTAADAATLWMTHTYLLSHLRNDAAPRLRHMVSELLKEAGTFTATYDDMKLAALRVNNTIVELVNNKWGGALEVVNIPRRLLLAAAVTAHARVEVGDYSHIRESHVGLNMPADVESYLSETEL